MSARRRPLAELRQSRATSTPSRYAPSTPHARQALQERNSAKRSARSARSVNKPSDYLNNNTTLHLLRPDSSARNILKQFARITAAVTKKRVATPIQTRANKENASPGDDNDDSITVKRPYLSFNIGNRIEEEDSEILAAPTPSVLPDDLDTEDDEQQPTITFQNIRRAASEKADGRYSLVSALGQTEDGDLLEDEDQDGDVTVLTERGRRAVSEEATRRFSRYSFGSIRMSDFGSELEIRRNSDRQKKLADLEAEDNYDGFDIDDTPYLEGETQDLRTLQRSPSADMIDGHSFQTPGLEDDTFRLALPEDDEVTQSIREDQMQRTQVPRPVLATSPLRSGGPSTADVEQHNRHESATETDSGSRAQTLLEIATTTTHKKRQKRMRLTRHGSLVPCLPPSLIKRVATETQTIQGKRKPKFGRDHVQALEQATEWFFEQIGDDLAAYSGHARRKKRVNDDDVLLLMRRQRLSLSEGELVEMAKQWLPKEMCDTLDLPQRL